MTARSAYKAREVATIERRSVAAPFDSIIKNLNPFALARNLWTHRDLVRQFTGREIAGRYKGSFFGLFWSFFHPLVLLLTYTFVFGLVFKSRWGGHSSASLGEFSLVLFSGLIAFNVFSESVNRSAGLIPSVPNYVKKVVFPLEILPVSVLGSSLFHALVSLGILVGASLAFGPGLRWTLVLLPVVALPLLFLTLGLSWFLAALGVYVRDVHYTVTLVVQVSFFVTPIFYPLDAVPEGFRHLVELNPLSPVVDNFRRVILWGTLPEWKPFAVWLGVTGVVMLLGYAWFMKTKKGFSDVI